MDYRSYADLTRVLSHGLHLIPADVDLVVAIPRSGIIPATMLALSLNLPTTDLEGFLNNRILPNGRTRRFRHIPRDVTECKHALVLDDSIYSGDTFLEVRKRIQAAKLPIKVTYAAVFATKESKSKVDLYFDICPFPRAFEWNFIHHHTLGKACVDIDGVLCLDPRVEENDDGPRYREFILNARPLHIPTRRIHHLVTSRLEKYRPETEEWMRRNGVEYDRLSMIDLPDAETRRRLRLHGKFKAEVYRKDHEAELFIESERPQALEIARSAGKPVLCIADHTFIKPEALSAAALHQSTVRARRGVAWFFRAGFNRLKMQFRAAA